jgi:hypothetical protein
MYRIFWEQRRHPWLSFADPTRYEPLKNGDLEPRHAKVS